MKTTENVRFTHVYDKTYLHTGSRSLGWVMSLSRWLTHKQFLCREYFYIKVLLLTADHLLGHNIQWLPILTDVALNPTTRKKEKRKILSTLQCSDYIGWVMGKGIWPDKYTATIHSKLWQYCLSTSNLSVLWQVESAGWQEEHQAGNSL